MASVLVCNLTRFGDLLQTQPLLDALAARGHKTSLVCLDAFSKATALLRNLEHSLPLPMAPISTREIWQEQAASVLEATSEIRDMAKPDWLVNLTPSPVARLLTRLLCGPKTRVLGFGMDENGFGINQGTWSSFLSMAARDRHYSPFNLTDILRKIGGSLAGDSTPPFCLSKPQAAELAWADAFLSHLPANANGFVCFQPGASNEDRRWPVEHFRELGKILWEKAALTPVLLGSEGEKPLAEKYARDCDHPHISAIGETTLPQLATLLSKAPLLVTNDTGTMHLAAGLGTPSLAFFLATAQPWDTGPALPGSCCLEPALPCHPCGFDSTCHRQNGCRVLISPQTAAKLILAWRDSGSWQAGVTDSARREARIWETTRDENGLINLRSLSGHDKEERIAWFITLRQFWSQLLDGLDGVSSNESADSSQAQGAREVADSLKEAAEITTLLIQNGRLLRKDPGAGERFLKNCGRLQTVLDQRPALGSIAAFWREFQLNQGADLNFFLASLPLFRKEFLWLGKKAA